MTARNAGSDRQPRGADDEQLWRDFATATTGEAFCRAWLALLCRQLPGVSAGVVLLEAQDAHTFVPIAAWPEPVRDLSHLGKVAQRALGESRGVIDRSGEAGARVAHVAYPIVVGERVVGAVALEVAATSEADVGQTLRQLHWSIAWLHELFQRRELESAAQRTERIGTVMEAVATALKSGKLQQTLFELTNEISRRLGCSRVAIGFVEADKVRVAALSDAAWFDRNTALVKRYAAAMDECYDRRMTIGCDADDGDEKPEDSTEPRQPAAPAHEALLHEGAATAVLSVPLILGAACTGVITLERADAIAIDDDQRTWVELLATLLPAVIDQKRRAERGYFARIRDDLRALGGRLFGPRHLVWKFGTALALILLALLTLVEIDYRVSAKTVIEGEIQRVAAAPFEGFVAASHVRAGDTVKRGQLLAEMDERDLKIEQNRWTSERDQYDRKLREAMANRDMTALQVIGAQLQQAEAQLALVNERLKRARVTAPFDGVVVTGDLNQLIGSPVEQGKKLFEIAPLESYRVILQVDEREVRHVEAGQTGNLVISGIAGDPLAFKVLKVTPIATAQDSRNFFRVEAMLAEAPPRLRPGMEGIGKIGVGEKRLWWILTHSFTDWLRLSLWTWMP